MIDQLSRIVSTAMSSSRKGLIFVVPFLLLTLSGCDRGAARIQALEAENELLKADIESLRKKLGEANTAVTAKDTNLDVSLKELWTQRFEDNQFRAKQRLDRKEIRVTGTVDGITGRSVTLIDTSARFGAITLLAQLDDDFLKQNFETLAALQKGIELTVQGRFLFDKMWLENAIFVDRKSGKPLTNKDLTSLTGEAEKPAEKPAELVPKTEPAPTAAPAPRAE
jgi:hypothetical protein